MTQNWLRTEAQKCNLCASYSLSISSITPMQIWFPLISGTGNDLLHHYKYLSWIKKNFKFHERWPITVPGWYLVFGYLIVILPLISNERNSLFGYFFLKYRKLTHVPAGIISIQSCSKNINTFISRGSFISSIYWPFRRFNSTKSISKLWVEVWYGIFVHIW